jgi:predicted ester cyclase
MHEEKNKQVIREFTRIFKNQYNVNGVSHLFDKNFVHHFRGSMPAGFEGLMQIGIMMNGAFQDVVVTEEDLIASADKVVERSSAVATNAGSMMGAPPTNQQVKWSEIHIYRLQDGKIVEHWAEIHAGTAAAGRPASSTWVIHKDTGAYRHGRYRTRDSD